MMMTEARFGSFLSQHGDAPKTSDAHASDGPAKQHGAGQHEAAGQHGPEHGHAALDVPVYALTPFALLLLAIAVLPLTAGHWWEHNKNKGIVAGALAAPILIWLIAVSPIHLAHTMTEYVSFIALLGALFVIAGGIHISGDLEGKPQVNVAILGIGAVLANFFGTTGASMLLIRLLLRTNAQRKNVWHLPFFFILLVSNVGGLLTPLGDPPLFLGYLRGVPFTWTLGLFPFWIIAVSYLLTVFFFIDRSAYAKEDAASLARDREERVPMAIQGWVNVALLACVVGAVLLPTPAREIVMISLAIGSYVFGPKLARKKNDFDFGPIIEVAVLFIGIFITMVPALQLLEHHGGELGLTKAWQFFLVTGFLSSVLDNAPTYLTFFSTAQALHLPDEVVQMPARFLAAISIGAVFMGANTYIGNGPNFMVKAIADSAGYKTPSFFAYAGRAVLTLAPIYVMITLYFLLT